MLGPRSNYFIPESYVIREDAPHFDDTPFQDEYQDDVYREARKLFMEHGFKTVVDYGCGSGFKLRKYFSGHQACGIEVEPTLSWLKEKYPDGYWSNDTEAPPGELLICADVIEHVADPDAFMARIVALKPELVIISTPACDFLGTENGPPRNVHHVREWSVSQFGSYMAEWLVVHGHYLPTPGTCCQVVVGRPLRTQGRSM